jgi:hypothetical protein
MKAIVDGQEVTVGDIVCFKSDIEQSGVITAIQRTPYGVSLTVENKHGFSGDYIGGDTITTELARDCWIDG